MLFTDRNASNFAANLRSLCDSQKSISDVCRGMGVSRQQFNKYLSGRHMPSRSNLELISSYFLLSSEEMLLSPVVFDDKIRRTAGKTLKSMSRSPRFLAYGDLIEEERAHTLPYCGVYERYHFSAIYAGHVLRSVVTIQDNDGLICHSYVERFPNRDRDSIADTVFKYHGFTSMIAGRLFMIDFECARANEMTTTILVPRMRGASPLLFGLTMGVAASLAREPFSTRVAMRRVSTGKLMPAHLRRASALKPDDPTIPGDIKRYLEDDQTITRVLDSV